MAYHLYLVSSAGETATLRKDILDLEKSIHQHNKIVQFQTVPSQYLPKNLAFINHPTQSTINESFLRELFLQHLATVIEVNTVTLELKKARLHVSQQQQATQSTPPSLKPTTTTQPKKKTAAYSEQQVIGGKRKQPSPNPQ